MYDIVALGEVLIDFTNNGYSASGMRLFEQNPGGAPANMLTAATKLGLSTAFIGKVGTDMHGQFLKEVLEQQGIDTKGMILDPNFFTTLAFVELKENGERVFSFARKPGADTMLTKEDLNQDLLTNTKVFHFGSLSLTNDPSKTATYEAIRIAKDAGAIISYDPNYRAPLWENEKVAIEMMREPIPYVDMMKISDEETELLTGQVDPEAAAEILISQGVKVVVVTLGEKGALVRIKDGSHIVAGFKSQVVDTTGAGDSFWGSFVQQVLGTKKAVEELTLEELSKCVTYANAVASICVSKRGAIPAMPTKEEVEKRLNQG